MTARRQTEKLGTRYTAWLVAQAVVLHQGFYDGDPSRRVLLATELTRSHAEALCDAVRVETSYFVPSMELPPESADGWSVYLTKAAHSGD